MKSIFLFWRAKITRGMRNLSTEIDILEAQLQLVRSDEEDF